MSILNFEGLTVNELKEMLRDAELPVSGTKAQLIERLEGNLPGDQTISLDAEKTLPQNAIIDAEESLPWYRGTEVLTPPALIAIGVAVLMVTAIFVIQPEWLERPLARGHGLALASVGHEVPEDHRPTDPARAAPRARVCV